MVHDKNTDYYIQKHFNCTYKQCLLGNYHSTATLYIVEKVTLFKSGYILQELKPLKTR